MSRLDPDALERLIARAARSQPTRRAPATLQPRVLAAVAARRTQPLWQRSFHRWPWPARLAFGILALAAAAASGALPWAAAPLATAREFVTHLLGVGALGHLVVDAAIRAVPTLWLWAAAAGLVTLYAALAALASLTHRPPLASLAHRPPAGQP